jgi:hypothetical protein
VKVSLVEVKHIDLPQDMQRAIARRAEAERERRAKAINFLSKLPLGRQRLRPRTNTRDSRIFTALAPRACLGLLVFCCQPAHCLVPLFLLARALLCPLLECGADLFATGNSFFPSRLECLAFPLR